MANRRMFSKDIVDNDKFYDLPTSSQLLYFHLGLQADDDGFIYPKSIARKAGLKIEDLKPLIEDGFVIPFESGVVVITDWKRSNYIRKDTYTETQFKDERNSLTLGSNDEYLIGSSTSRQRLVNVSSPQYSIGKDSIGKDREEEEEQAPPKKTNSLRMTTYQITMLLEEFPMFTRDEIKMEIEKCNRHMAISSNPYENPGIYFKGWMKKVSAEKLKAMKALEKKKELDEKFNSMDLTDEQLEANRIRLAELRKGVIKKCQ